MGYRVRVKAHFGPAKDRGLQRSENTGSVKKVTPPSCTSREAWPTQRACTESSAG